MQVTIDFTKVSNNIAHSLRLAKIDGCKGEIVGIQLETNGVSVLFKYNNMGDKIAKIFHLEMRSVIVEI